MEATNANQSSPCNSVCEIDYSRGICLGCYRTLDEIARWATLTNKQRDEVLARVRMRRDGLR
jgi:hypothetical protein